MEDKSCLNNACKYYDIKQPYNCIMLTKGCDEYRDQFPIIK